MSKVSVVIPAHNVMEYLPSTLESLLVQTFQDFEVLVINDGSSDHIESWFSEAIDDNRVRLISQQNRGLSAARNTGIKYSRSPYIAFLDADDLWAPDKLEKQVSALDADPEVGLVYTWVAYINHLGSPTGRIRKSYAEGMVLLDLLKHNFVECGSVPLVRRECFDTLGLFDEELSAVEDWDMWLRIAAVYPFRVISKPLVFYRQHVASLSRRWSVMEAAFEKVLARAFASGSREIMAVKAKSYAAAYICVAWKPIQAQPKDCRESLRLLGKAVSCDRTILFSKEVLRLSIAILISRFVGNRWYAILLSVMHKIRYRVESKNHSLPNP